MKKKLQSLNGVLAMIIFLFALPATAKRIIINKTNTTKLTQQQSLTGLPNGFQQKNTNSVTFTENKGQVSDQNYKPRPDVLYSGVTKDMVYHIRKNGISYQLSRIDAWKDLSINKMGSAKIKKVPAKTTFYRLDINWLNSNGNYSITTDEELAGFNNYYLPVCPNGIHNVKTYTGITLKNIYTNIDVHYYEQKGILKYDYIIAAHADYKQIQLEVVGAENITVRKDGSITLKTPLGEIQEGAPLVYQNGKQINAKWVVKNNVLNFEIKNYNENLPLVIDPTVTREWGTYYGGTGVIDVAWGCATDTTNNIYIAGMTTSGSAIASVGSHQSTGSATISDYGDAFLAKFNIAGERIWGTYYGGNNGTGAFSCSTDAFGNVFIAGYTNTDTIASVIATSGSHQSIFGGGDPYISDAFLAKFNVDGVRLWGTYYGGHGADLAYSCATDAVGNVYIAGITDSASGGGTIIATTGSHQSSYGGGYADGFLVKFNSDGVRQWGTYYGGGGGNYVQSCASDAVGNVYIAGQADSLSSIGTAIATPGSFQSTSTQPGVGYLVKFNNAGIRQWGTFYGGNAPTDAWACTVDAFNHVYLAGIVNAPSGSDTAIATTGSFQTTFSGDNDAYLVQFTSAGVRKWGTYYGGNRATDAAACTTDAKGNIYMAGQTNSDSIATVGSHQSVLAKGPWYWNDAYIVKFDSLGARQWATYYGGIGGELAHTCTVNDFGIYMAGETTTSDTSAAIASPGAWQTTSSVTNGSESDAFFVKFNDCDIVMPDITKHDGSDTLYSSSAATYQWYKDGILISGANTQFFHPTENGNYTVCVTAHGETCKACSLPFSFTTGINEYTLTNAIYIYPNPNNGQFEIALQLNKQDNYTLELTNALGQVLYHEELKNYIGTYHKQLDESKYGAGVYLFRVKNSKEQSVKKVISF